MNFQYIPQNCITMEQCNSSIFHRVVKECSKTKVEFVWFFIIGFFFSNIGYILLDNRVSLAPRLKTRLIDAFKFAGYILQLIGILWFILGGYI